MTTETSAERLHAVRSEATYIFNANTGLCDGVDLKIEDYEWLIQQAERAQELEFTDTAIERRSLLNSLKECDEELTRWQTGQNMTGENYNEIRRLNIEKSRLWEALEEIKFQTTFVETSDNVLEAIEQALKGESE